MDKAGRCYWSHWFRAPGFPLIKERVVKEIEFGTKVWSLGVDVARPKVLGPFIYIKISVRNSGHECIDNMGDKRYIPDNEIFMRRGGAVSACIIRIEDALVIMRERRSRLEETMANFLEENGE